MERGKTVRVLKPNNEAYKGKDAASISEMSGVYVPFFLSKSADGIIRALNSDLESIILFNEVNSDFYHNVVCPLAGEMNRKGLDALEEFKRKHVKRN